MGWTHMSELFQVYNNLEERVGKKENDKQNDNGSVDVSVTSQNSMITKGKCSTYAEAVKKHIMNFMKNINEHISLNRNNPFLKHLNRLI